MINCCQRNLNVLGFVTMGVLILTIGCQAPTASVDVSLTCQPMLGHVGMREAYVWAQFHGELETSELKFELTSSNADSSSLAITQSFQDFDCVIWQLDGLEPGTEYSGVIKSGNHPLSDTILIQTQVLWQYRTEPPELTIGTGSCLYINETAYDRPGSPYGGDYRILESIAAENIDAMLWLGDNVYLREVDFGSYSGYGHRYSHMRQTPELQSLLSACSHYAIWDDHDFGPNDCDGSWIHQDWARKAFDSFWPNPANGLPEGQNLNVSSFQIADVEFFLLDNRSQRVNHDAGPERRQILGQVQLEWLTQALNNSRAPFKLVAIGGQVLSDAPIYENMARFPEERSQLLQRIDELDIRGVVFLTGDRHNSELTQLQLPGGRWIYDLTVSPLTSGSYDHSEEPNTLRVAETMVGQRNYATLNFSGSRKERVLRMEIKDSDGHPIWTRSIDAGNGYALGD